MQETEKASRGIVPANAHARMAVFCQSRFGGDSAASSVSPSSMARRDFDQASRKGERRRKQAAESSEKRSKPAKLSAAMTKARSIKNASYVGPEPKHSTGNSKTIS